MFHTGFEPGTTKTVSFWSTDLPKIKKTTHREVIWICHLYDLDWVDDQYSHGKSVGKYHMVIRVKRVENISRMLPVLWPEKVFLKRFRSF